MSLVYIKTDKDSDGETWIDPSTVAAIKGYSELSDEERGYAPFPYTDIFLKNGVRFGLWISIEKVLSAFNLEQSPHL